MEKWPPDLSPTELAQWLNRQYGPETLMAHLRMQVVEVGLQRVVVEMPVESGLFTPMGAVHAGAMLSLADTTATIAAIAAYRGGLEPERFPVAVSLSAQVVGNVSEGVLTAESQIAHPGRTLMAAATRITSGEGRLLALVNSTHYVRPPA